MRRFLYLTIAITGNALGTALMEKSSLGMTAWGFGSKNFSNWADVSLGMSFFILSIVFYMIAVIIRKQWYSKEFVFSFLFLLSFGFVVDVFMLIIPSIEHYHIVLRVLINITGLLILLFAISVHIFVNIAVHPMDVYLKELQTLFQSIRKGTYVAYVSAIFTGVIFGLFSGNITAFGIGTLITVLCSGVIIDFYMSKILYHWKLT